MINMGEWHKTMQRRIDGSGTRIEIECAVRKETDHTVFVFNALIDAFQRVELVLIKRSKAVEHNGADIAARALDPKYWNLFAGQRIDFLYFCRCIPATIIGDALIGTEQV